MAVRANGYDEVFVIPLGNHCPRCLLPIIVQAPTSASCGQRAQEDVVPKRPLLWPHGSPFGGQRWLVRPRTQALAAHDTGSGYWPT